MAHVKIGITEAGDAALEEFDINEYDDPDYFEQQKIAELEEKYDYS